MLESINKVPNTNCIYIIDENQNQNQNQCRNNCIKEALLKGSEIIGFVDDDDVGVFDCVDIITEELKNNDVVYCNFKSNHFESKYSGDVKKDLNRNIDPFVIFLTSKTATSLFEKYGEVFNEKVLSLDGEYLMFRLIIGNYKIKHIPNICYHRNKANPLDSVGYRNFNHTKGLMKMFNEKLNYKIFN